MAIKANLKELPVKHYNVSSSDVVDHLQNELGFKFDCDFKIWDNRAEWEKPMATNKCFVIMRAVFRPEDIVIQANTHEYADRVLSEVMSGIKFKDNVMKTLEPFMFPKNMGAIKQYPERLQVLAEQGIYGEHLEELIRRPRLFLDKVNNRFGIYLRPEKIITDMMTDPATGKPAGAISFGYVSDANGNAASISWGVNLYENLSAAVGGVSIDAVFNTFNQ
jgi:hypothetical protein